MISHEYEGIRLNIIYDISKFNIPFLLDKLMMSEIKKEDLLSP